MDPNLATPRKKRHDAAMVEMNVTYQGDKHCELIHGPSGSTIQTDAPKDNNGRGEAFSPTDLCAVSLATCMLTVMAIQAEKEGVELKGSTAKVTKEMHASPRRIKRIGVQLTMPKKISTEWRVRLEHIARTCPVHLSLHPEIEIDLRIAFEI